MSLWHHSRKPDRALTVYITVQYGVSSLPCTSMAMAQQHESSQRSASCRRHVLCTRTVRNRRMSARSTSAAERASYVWYSVTVGQPLSALCRRRYHSMSMSSRYSDSLVRTSIQWRSLYRARLA